MKKLLLSLLVLCWCFSYAQQRNCATTRKMQERIEADPAFAAKNEQVRAQLASATNTIMSTTGGAATNVVVTVPVVFHVLYKNATQNISDAQIDSQLAVLNADFRKQNADFTTVVPPVFQPFGADMEIVFVKATTTPQGLPTNGVTRKPVATNFNFATQYYTGAGQPAWNTLEYVNIWIGEFNDDTLGFAYQPAAAGQNYDGLCIGYNYFGTTGTAQWPYNKGRTATHEMGHYFGLDHLWGNPGPWGDDCINNDFVADTPATDFPYYDCTSFPNFDNVCPGTTAPNGAMFMNFMDYVPDACMAFFTHGQKARTQAAINGPRASVLGVKNHQLAANLKVYPNPSSDFFKISSPDVAVEKVEIYNSAGQLVKSERVNQDAPIYVNQLESGIYYLRMYSGNSVLKSEKLIVN